MKNKAKWVSAEPEHGKLGEVVRMWQIRNEPRTRSRLFSCISWARIKLLALYCFTRFFSHFYIGRSLIDMWGDQLHWHCVSNRTMCDQFVFNKFSNDTICFIRPDERPWNKNNWTLPCFKQIWIWNNMILMLERNSKSVQ